MKKFAPAFLIAALFLLPSAFAAEWMSIDGKPAEWNDILEVRLRDLIPTQPSIGFDRIRYKMGRYAKDRRKVFDEYCEKNGRKGIKNFSFDPAKSDLHDPATFECLEPVGFDLAELKTAVIGPDGRLYLTDGHHTFNAFWQMPLGGPDLKVNVLISRDYRAFKTMDEFWKQMEAEKNVWLFDANGRRIEVTDLPKSLGVENFGDDEYRSLMFFTRRIAWNPPGDIVVPDPKDWDERYPGVPFLEFYWAQEVRKMVDLSQFNLSTKAGYLAAIRAVGNSVMKIQSTDIGGSGKSAVEMGQSRYFNEKELHRISRPGTGKIDYLMNYKARRPSFGQTYAGN